MGFLFDNLFTQIKDATGAEVPAATDTDPADNASTASFYMGVDRVQAKVTCDVLNVRETPSTEKPRVGQLHRGASICVTGVCDDWLAIDLQGKTCYVCSRYTDFDAPRATVTASALNVRKGPSTDDEKIGSLPNGAEIKIIGEENGWIKILYNNKTGYVSAQYIQKI